jgi:hypothetical protein
MASQSVGLGSIPMQSMWDMWWSRFSRGELWLFFSPNIISQTPLAHLLQPEPNAVYIKCTFYNTELLHNWNTVIVLISMMWAARFCDYASCFPASIAIISNRRKKYVKSWTKSRYQARLFTDLGHNSECSSLPVKVNRSDSSRVVPIQYTTDMRPLLSAEATEGSVRDSQLYI